MESTLLLPFSFTVEMPKTTILQSFPLRHLSCSTEDEMYIKQPTSLFGHGCLGNHRKRWLQVVAHSDYVHTN